MSHPQLQTHTFTDPSSGLTLPYRLFVPAACTPGKPCGILLFLHGAGERGTDNQAQLKNHALAFLHEPTQQRYPTVVVYPQCPTGQQWVEADWTRGSYSVPSTPISKPLSAAVTLLDHLIKTLPVDPRRQLVTGLSMGGYGTWDLLARFPTRFVAAMPLCGGGDPSQAAGFARVPIWAFHGAVDPVVPVRGSRKMIQALRDAGGTPVYDEAAGVGHDIWDHAYTKARAVSWLLSGARE